MKIESGYPALAVDDLERSLRFYEKIGFRHLEGAGSVKEKWLLMENGNAKIGLFEKMLPANTLTFNSGQVREFYEQARSAGVEISHASKSIGKETGPCSFMTEDPDGNLILFDQHN